MLSQPTRRGPSGPRAVLADHGPRPPRDRGNLAGFGRGMSPLQVIDQHHKGLPVVFFETRQMAKGTGVSAVTVGISDGNSALVHVDTDVGPPTNLGEQPHKVVGLTLIRRRSFRSSGAIGTGGTAVHVCLSRLEWV